MAEKKLLQLLDSINLDKNTNLLPTTLKDGVTCLGVEGDVAPLSITEDATATAADMAAGKTAYINNEKVTGMLFESTDEVVELGLTSDISIGNVASDGVNTVEVKKLIKNDMILRTGQDAGISIVGSDLAKTLDITPEKIIEGNTILGVVGTGTTGVDTSDATAAADNIEEGKTAYVNGEKIEGTLSVETQIGTIASSVELNSDFGIVNLKAEVMSDLIAREGAEVLMSATEEQVATAANITSEQIVEGNTILGVKGTIKSLDITNDATATSEDIAMGKSAYVKGKLLNGTAFEIPSDGIYEENWNQEVTIETNEADGITRIFFVGNPADDNYMIRPGATIKILSKLDTFTNKIGLTADKILEGNTILGVVGTAKQEEGTKVYTTLEELQAVTGTEGQFAIVNSGETFDGAYKYTNGAWVEMFSSRRYDGTLTPEDYTTATETASNILGE